ASFEARTVEASNRSRELTNSLSTQVNQLVDRLAASNSRLGQLVDLTSKSFIEIDDRLTATTDTFGTRTEKAAREISTSVSMLEGNVGRLSDLSSGTLGEVAGIVNKFDEHSRTLQRANELLTAAQSNLQHTLEDRREALDSLASGLVLRSKEIEAVLGAMSGQIEATLERSENRTRSSAASLQNTVSAVFDAATTKFADATSKLETASNTIRDELDATRDELRRGLVDLPAETKQTTETLRRAVTDQIGALRELSEVMAKNSRDRDVREPVSTQRRAVVDTAPAYVEPRPAPAARQAEPRANEQRAPSENTGWVSTLLRSANQSEPAPVAPRRQTAPLREPNQVIDSLNSISVDIARAIDHNAAVDLWERYRRGERDVFTRRLYTLRGQETFDDIRRKYEVDREFRLSVTRYCEDFEKLLSDVSRSDPEGKAAQRYLTSDTGKVYTMLAHASGRLR
ncbi:MAG: kinesin, partial [Notoacmeibacter sp.]